MADEGGGWPVEERKMTLEELVGWLDSNDVSYEVDDAGRLTAKGVLREGFWHWVKARKYTGLPDELVRIDGALWLGQTSIVSLGGLTSVGGNLDLTETPITSLDNLTSGGGWLYLQDTPLTSLGNLTSVGGDLDLWGTSITSLGNLTSVGGALNLNSTPLTFLDNLPQVGEDLFLDQSQFQLLTRRVLQKVKGKIRYRDQATEEWWLTWATLSPDELETIVAENERREMLNNTRGNDMDWDLYDR